jgi:spore maturation protein CgeB
MTRSAIADVARLAPIVAWNSDDDWQWESYTRLIAPLFTYAITTYPHIYHSARRDYPNLLLSQWGCLETYADFSREKNLDFTFVGQVYRNRVAELRTLRKQANLRVFGLGSLRVSFPPMNNRIVRKCVSAILPTTNRALAFPEVHAIWNRSRISYTPLGASKDPRILQIKGRVFQMGLSGTLMLCQASDNLEPYYTAGKEYVQFYDLQDCISKAQYYLEHESERAWIANAYAARTRAEHLWTHRFNDIFSKIGISLPRGTGVSPVLAA